MITLLVKWQTFSMKIPYVLEGDSNYIKLLKARGGARGVMLSSHEMDMATWVKILDETDCISHSTNTLGKGMNPIFLPPAMSK